MYVYSKQCKTFYRYHAGNTGRKYPFFTIEIIAILDWWVGNTRVGNSACAGALVRWRPNFLGESVRCWAWVASLRADGCSHFLLQRVLGAARHLQSLLAPHQALHSVLRSQPSAQQMLKFLPASHHRPRRPRQCLSQTRQTQPRPRSSFCRL